MAPSHLLVTVGSTLFQSLTDAALSIPTLELISALGTSRLVVQLGRAQIPSHIAIHVGSDGGQYVFQSKVGNKLEVTVMRYTDKMDTLLAAASAVVSHAGSGTILAVLRRQPRVPLLVVPNSSLMDNHQRELADALSAGNYLIVANVDDLSSGLRRLLDPSESTEPFPAPEPTRFRSILDETAGYA